ncbi:MAG: peptidylprolyl isomerase [Actinomycetota bacterium]
MRGSSAGRARGPVLLALVALLAAGCAQAYGDKYDPVAAVVNGVEIPHGEMIGTLRLQLDGETLQALGGDGKATNYLNAQRAVLAGLIQTEVMVQEADDLGVTVSDGEVDERLARVRGRFDTEDKYLATLRIAGLDEAGLRNQLRKGLLQDRVAVEAGKGAVPEAELVEAYERNKALFDIQIQVAHILVCGKQDPSTGLCTGDSPEDRKAAEALALRARTGEVGFSDLASRFSADRATRDLGGDLGWLSQDQLPQDFGVAVARLQPGGITDPVRTDLGWHVVKLLDRGRTFEQAREEIEQGVGGERLQAKVNEFLSKAISAATITVNPRFGRFDPETQSVVANELARR